jgi:hypothetical protein
MSNLNIWDKYKTPDVDYVKKVNMRGGFINVDAQYLLQLATEQFGPYGAGFGLSVSDMDFGMFTETKHVIHKAVFFYVLNGERHEFPITNSVEAMSKKGFFDTEFAKKVETNTVSKALSKLGFAADVYMGLFDDDLYVQDVLNEQAMEKADNKDELELKQRQEHIEWLEKSRDEYSLINSVTGIKNHHTKIVRKLARLGDNETAKKFDNLYQKRLAELNNETA